MGFMRNCVDDFLIITDSDINGIQTGKKVIVIALAIPNAMSVYVHNQQWDENDIRQ